ncbi:uncharacterized protein LOC106639173 [Copidosoma floridanum]|uniref:uncharacterized protein LOC106639173 n=1 Tax=Copidosoma floridanum TaxID=29053 RepID=UPI0006C9D93C|nr:uncharacterized protein LOC106639173 [Copidosoma floridanum]
MVSSAFAKQVDDSAQPPRTLHKMKRAFATLLVFVYLSVAKSMDLHFMDEMLECGHEMGMDTEQIRNVLLTKDDEKLGCLNACVLKKLGVMIDGKLHEENLYEVLEKHKDTIYNFDEVKEAVEDCYDEVDEAEDLPECQLARKFSICMDEHLSTS